MSRKLRIAGWLLCMMLVAGEAALAQMPSQEELVKRREAKLAEPFLKNAAWVTDYDAALAQATESKKLIFAYFTRSYAG